MIQGLDCSHWQGTAIDWPQAKAAGIDFVYLKASQGIAYKDDCFDANASAARAAGILVGAYHFMTIARASDQYQWFIKCIGATRLDLPPAIDLEQYNEPGRGNVLPDGATAETMLKLLTGFQGHALPLVYTNKSFGDAIFVYPKYAAISRYPLWVANWKVLKPVLPTVWAKAVEPYCIWQDNVVSGAQFGFQGQVDHDIWGDRLPFPGGTTAGLYADITITLDGKTYQANHVEFTKCATF